LPVDLDEPIASGLRPRADLHERINSLFSSDVGHFDVPDMRMSCRRPMNLSSNGLITAEDL